jgi:DNA repair protein RadC
MGVKKHPSAVEGYNIELVMEVNEAKEPYSRMGSSYEVAEIFAHMKHYHREHFVVACVDAKLRLTGVHTVSIGTLTASIVHPREVYKVAMIANASGMFLLHNHPSGDPTPSEEDRRITTRLEECGTILGIPVLDHLIIGRANGYYSFADAGDMEPQAAGYRGMVLREDSGEEV